MTDYFTEDMGWVKMIALCRKCGRETMIGDMVTVTCSGQPLLFCKACAEEARAAREARDRPVDRPEGPRQD